MLPSKEEVKLIPEQAILIENINILNGRDALSLSRNFNLKHVFYNIDENNGSYQWYITINDFTTFLQLISFLTSYYVIKLKSYDRDGFTMLLIIEEKKSIFA